MYRKCTWCRIRYLLSFEKHYKDRIANENMRKIYLFSLVLDHFLDFFFVGIMFLKYVRFGSMSEIYERLCWLLQGSEICTDSRTSSKGRLHIAFCICCKKEHPLFDITSVRRKKFCPLEFAKKVLLSTLHLIHTLLRWIWTKDFLFLFQMNFRTNFLFWTGLSLYHFCRVKLIGMGFTWRLFYFWSNSSIYSIG